MNSLQMTSSRPPKQISRRTTLSNRSRNLADKLVYYIWQLRSELLSETGTRARHSVAAFRDIISNLPRIGLYHGGTPWTRQRDRLPFCCLPATQAERWSGIHSAASPLIPSRHIHPRQLASSGNACLFCSTTRLRRNESKRSRA